MAHSKVYALGSFLNRSAGLVLIPVYARVLGPEEFGLYALVTMVTDIMGVVFGAGIANGMVRIYFESESEQERRCLVSTAYAGFGLAMLSATALAYPASSFIGNLLFGTHKYRTVIFLAYGGMMFSILFDMGLNYLRILKKSWLYLWISLVKCLAFLSLNILFVVHFKMGVTGVFSGTLLSTLLVSVCLTAGILSSVGLSFSREKLGRILRFGLPLFPATLADIALNGTDRYFLNRFTAVATVGYYALGSKIASLLHVFITAPFAQIWIVRRLESMDKAEGEGEYAGILTYFLTFLTAVGLSLSLMAPEVLLVVASRNYDAAAPVIPLLVVSYIAFAVTTHFQISIFHAKKTDLVLYVSITCFAVNVLLNVVLIPRYGAVGAGTVMLLTNVLRATMTYWLGAWLCPHRMEFEWKRIGGVLVLAAIFFLGGNAYTGVPGSLGAVAVKLSAVLLFLCSIVATGIIRIGEIRELATAARGGGAAGVRTQAREDRA